MKLRISIILFMILLAMSACSREKRRLEPAQQETPDLEPSELKEKMRFSKKDRAEEAQQEIGTIEEFTPELFIRLTILYRKQSLRWLEESSMLSDQEQQRYYEEANRQFFVQFGITEEEYIRYSTEHIEELNSYIEEHPELVSQLQGE
jgi:hypothetical protein